MIRPSTRLRRRRPWLVAALVVLLLAGVGAAIASYVRPGQAGGEPQWLRDVAARQEALPVCTDVLTVGACRASVGGSGTRTLPANAVGDSWRYEFGVLIARELKFPSGQLARLGLREGGVLAIFATAADQDGITVQLADDNFDVAASPALDDGVWHWISITCTSAGDWTVKVDGRVVLSGTGLAYEVPRSETRSPTGDSTLTGVAFTVGDVPAADSYETSTGRP